MYGPGVARQLVKAIREEKQEQVAAEKAKADAVRAATPGGDPSW